MDTDLLFVLALVAFYVLRQLAGRRTGTAQKPQPRRQLPPEARTGRGDETFDDALAEIRRALGMETPGRPSAPPTPVEQHDGEFHRVETGMPDRETRFDRRERTPTFAEDRFESRMETGTVYDDAFERAEPYRAMPQGGEDRFERGPSRFADPLKGHSHVAPIRVPLDEPLPTPPERKRSRRLGTRRQLREAFVLKEIVGPPRAVRRSIR